LPFRILDRILCCLTGKKRDPGGCRILQDPRKSCRILYRISLRAVGTETGRDGDQNRESVMDPRRNWSETQGKDEMGELEQTVSR